MAAPVQRHMAVATVLHTDFRMHRLGSPFIERPLIYVPSLIEWHSIFNSRSEYNEPTLHIKDIQLSTANVL